MSFKIFLERFVQRIKKRIRYMSREKKRLWLVGVIALVIGGLLGGRIGCVIEKNRAEKELKEVTMQIKEEGQERVSAIQDELDRALDDGQKELPWNLVLVNYNHPMEEGYEIPKLTELEPGYSVDSRIAEAANQMLQDAKKDGMRIIICSAYRSVVRQEQVFNESMQDRLNGGASYWDAFSETRLSVAEPGTSEHALGLALDLISNQYTELDEGQEETKEAKWLEENCHKYGFILRYPPEKTDITGIIYEPWHYRYVGVEDATKIMELGITLEEYLEEYY